jgi:hypothetical protein
MNIHQAINARASIARSRYRDQHPGTLASVPYAKSRKPVSGSVSRNGDAWKSPAGMLRWIESPEACGLVDAGFADKISGHIDYNGWYTNEFFDETLRGIVYKLPGRRGYLAGYADPHNRGAACLAIEAIDDIDDAARTADRIAELVAESEREYNAAMDAVREARQALEDARTHARECLDVVRQHRALGLVNPAEYGEACEALDDAMADFRAKRDEAVDLDSYAKRHHEISWNDLAP